MLGRLWLLLKSELRVALRTFLLAWLALTLALQLWCLLENPKLHGAEDVLLLLTLGFLISAFYTFWPACAVTACRVVYRIALSVAACLRAGTRVDVAWVVDTDVADDRDRADALAITPGGGRVGSLVSGALDSQLSDLASRGSADGRLLDLQIGDVDALVAGLPRAGTARCGV